jgi:hypothetical protein
MPFQTTSNPRTIHDFEQNEQNRQQVYRRLPKADAVDDSEKVVAIVRPATDAEVPEERRTNYKTGCSHWVVCLQHQGRRSATVVFSQGRGHFVTDASGTDQSFEDWASDLDYDSRKIEAMYQACVKIRHDLEKTLSVELYDELVEANFDWDEFEDIEEVCEARAGETARSS